MASSKPEEMSVSKKQGRDFVNRFVARFPDYTVEELDLYAEDLPEPSYRYFKGRCELVSGPEYDALSAQEKEAVDRINALCTQFQAADCYVFASPMWSLNIPSRLKQYLDCILLNQRVICIDEKQVQGLLSDKPREMVYIQSSGGVYPKLVDFKFNYGVNYVHDLFRHLGIAHFYKIFIQGTDMEDVGPEEAVCHAQEDMDDVLEKIKG